jgi:hypothetical protein
MSNSKTRRIAVLAAKAETEGVPEPAPEVLLEAEGVAAGGAEVATTAGLSRQIAGLEGLIMRLVGTVEG